MNNILAIVLVVLGFVIIKIGKSKNKKISLYIGLIIVLASSIYIMSNGFIEGFIDGIMGN